MTATPIKAADVQELRELKAKMDRQVDALRLVVPFVQDDDLVALNAQSLQILGSGYALLEYTLSMLETVAAERDRLSSQLAHPAGKGRCRCFTPPAAHAPRDPFVTAWRDR